MNNSKIALDTGLDLELEEKRDVKPALREQENKLVDIIEAIEHVTNSNYWRVLQEREFLPDLEALKTHLAEERDEVKIYRLQGQIEKARKFDLSKLLLVKRNELLSIRKKLNDASVR